MRKATVTVEEAMGLLSALSQTLRSRGLKTGLAHQLPLGLLRISRLQEVGHGKVAESSAGN